MSYARQIEELAIASERYHRELRYTLLLAAVALLIAAAALALAIARAPRPVVYTSGPCAFLGLAALRDDPDTPVLVADCDGTQLGLPVVLP